MSWITINPKRAALSLVVAGCPASDQGKHHDHQCDEDEQRAEDPVWAEVVVVELLVVDSFKRAQTGQEELDHEQEREHVDETAVDFAKRSHETPCLSALGSVEGLGWSWGRVLWVTGKKGERELSWVGAVTSITPAESASTDQI